MNTIYKLTYYFFIAIIVLVGCRQTIINPNTIFQSSKPSDSLLFYFPQVLNHVSETRPSYNNFAQKWFSSTLYSLKEPILYKKTDSDLIYRFLWLRSLGPPPVCFSIKKSHDKFYLNVKVLDKTPSFYLDIYENVDSSGNNKYDTLGKGDRLAFINYNETIKLTRKEWEKIETLLNEMHFWTEPSLGGGGSSDADEWILEGYKNSLYHFIKRADPEDSFKTLGLYLIKLSGFKFPKYKEAQNIII